MQAAEAELLSGKKRTEGLSLPDETKLQWLGFGFGRHIVLLRRDQTLGLRFDLPLALLLAQVRSLLLYFCLRVAHLPVTCKTCLLTRSRRPLRFCDFLRVSAVAASRKS